LFTLLQIYDMSLVEIVSSFLQFLKQTQYASGLVDSFQLSCLCSRSQQLIKRCWWCFQDAECLSFVN